MRPLPGCPNPGGGGNGNRTRLACLGSRCPTDRRYLHIHSRPVGRAFHACPVPGVPRRGDSRIARLQGRHGGRPLLSGISLRPPGGYIVTRQARSGRQRECGTARFFECPCSAAASAFCRLSPDSFFPRPSPRRGPQIWVTLHSSFKLLRPQLPPASTVCWRLRPIRCVYVPAAGGGCGRACAQGGARLM